MSHVVLDGAGNLKYVLSLGAGTESDPLHLIAMAYDQAMVDKGVIFTHSDRHTVANNAYFNYLVKTPDAPAHVELLELDVVTNSGPVYLSLFENTIVSANGTAESLFNNNRQSSVVAGTLLYMTPTITSNGTALLEKMVPGEKGVGGQISARYRLILKQGYNYLLLLQNVSGQSATIAIALIIGED